MKNKIIASLMAAALFVGMAVPAFADRTGSTLLGDTESVTKIVAKNASYTIKNGDDKNMKEEVYVLASNSQLADDSNVSFELEDNKDLAFSITDGKVLAIDDKGTATLIVKSLDNEKISTKIKLTASKADKHVSASGFKFKDSQYTIGTDNAATDLAADKLYDETVTIVATPSGAKFDEDQRLRVLAAVQSAGAVFESITMGNTAVSLEESNKEMNIKFTLADLKTVKVGTAVAKSNASPKTYSGNTNSSFQVWNFFVTAFPVYNSTTTTGTPTKNAQVKIRTIPALKANVIGANGTITLKVGDTCTLSDNVKQGPSSATDNDAVTYSIEYYNTDADTTDYVAYVDDAAAEADKKIIGIHTGKVKVLATQTGSTNTATFIVNVVDNNAKTGAEVADGDVTLVNSTASTTVGATGFKMALKNLAADATVTYSSLNDAVAKVSLDGVVTGVAAGTTQIVADVDGVKLYCTVTVNAGTAEKPGPGVPQTGIVTLVALF